MVVWAALRYDSKYTHLWIGAATGKTMHDWYAGWYTTKMWVDKQNNIVTNSIIIELNNITLNILYPQLLASHNLWVGNWYRFEWQRVFLMVVTGRIIEQTIVLCYLVLFSSIYIVRFIVIMDTGQWYLTRSMLKDGLWKHNTEKYLPKNPRTPAEGWRERTF